MNRVRARRSVLWPGEDALAEAKAAIASGDAVDIVLPASEHHALCLWLSSDASGALEMEGGAELLARIAVMPGLADLSSLVPPAQRAGYRTELSGPPPVLSLLPA